MSRILGTLYFIGWFLKAFLEANLKVARIILFEDKKLLKPFFFDYDLSELTSNEALFLSHCITLTPGTISVSFSDDLNLLTVHVLSAKDAKSAQESIDRELKNPLLFMTRGTRL